MYTGPNLIQRDNIVWGYDTNYGVADSNTITDEAKAGTRFFKGRPTENRVANADTFTGWTAYGSGNSGTFMTEFGTVGYKINNKTSWNGLYKTVTVASTGTYTFSAWFRFRGSSSANNGATVYVSQYGAGDTATGLNKSKLGTWQRVEKTINFTDTDLTCVFYLISYGGVQNDAAHFSSWDVTMPQLEKQSDGTPFVLGTRSDTDSLIDLSRTYNIDASNVSYSATTGQPVFDGSNDFILTPFTRGTLGDALTMIAWYKFTGSTSRTYTPIFGGKEAGAGTEFFIGKNSGNTHIGVQDGNYSGSFVQGSNAWDGNYHQMVYTYKDGVGKIYLDGVLKSSGSFSKCNVAEQITVGSEVEGAGYYFIGDISKTSIYGTVLSAADIMEDFNTHRNRFNI